MFAHTLTLDTRTLRLTATYLAIIMVMSIGFSWVFYQVSMDQLTVRIKNDSIPNNDEINAVYSNEIHEKMLVPPEADGRVKEVALQQLNVALQHKIAASRTELRQQLLSLNLAALTVSTVFSYLLARWTLRPIEAALEAQSRFSSDASHELRTPLAVMQTEIDVTLRNPQLTLDRAKTALRHNRQAITQLRQLSEGLLRLTQHDHPLTDLAEIPLQAVIDEALTRTTHSAKAKRISITAARTTRVVRADAVSLAQLLVILLDNAVKYSPAQTTVHISTEADKHSTYIRVRDEGPGIAATDIPHIFERFYRADVSRSHQTSGYGLGLAIAQAIASQHRGSLTVASTIGHGSTFTLQLPR